MRIFKIFIILQFLIHARLAFANLEFNLPEGVTSTSHDVYALHMTVIWVCCVIGFLVFGAMIYSILFHQKSKKRKPAVFHEKLWLEITWTVIPFLILVVLAIPATRVLAHMNNYELSDLSIKVTGYQWKWRYEYLDQDIHFFSNISTPLEEIQGKKPKNPHYLQEVDHPLVVPIHKKIRFLVTSNDVLHSWSVPYLAIKREAVPGFINETWTRINRPGIYHGQCSELCGINHAYMPIVVIALSEKGFEEWLQQQKGVIPPKAPPTSKPVSSPSKTISPSATIYPVTKPLPEIMKEGEKLYLSTCAACHQPTGEGVPPTFPALKGSAIVKGPLSAHMNRVLNGKPGTAMPAFRDQFNDEELAAILTYERNAWGNNTGITVTPLMVKQQRNKPKEGE